MLAASLALALSMPGVSQALDFKAVAVRARDLAAAPYKPPSAQLPPELRDLDYDAYRATFASAPTARCGVPRSCPSS